MAFLQGKTVIVTGAAGGLGKAIASAFLAGGANVTICDVNPERIAAVESEWNSVYPGKFWTTQTDVTDEAAVTRLIESTASKFGQLDILVNNAGIMDNFSPVGECSMDMWRRVLAVNLDGPYLTSRAAINHAEKHKPAPEDSRAQRLLIINIGSSSSIYGFKAGAAYTVSKAGVMALTKNTAGFYGPKGISCVALLLGGMATNIADAFKQGMHMEMFQQIQASQTPMNPATSLVPIESVAKYCIFLSDPDIATAANGSCIVFNRNWPEA